VYVVFSKGGVYSI